MSKKGVRQIAIAHYQGIIMTFHQLEVYSTNEEQRVNRAKTILDHIEALEELDNKIFTVNDSFKHYIRSIANIHKSKYLYDTHKK